MKKITPIPLTQHNFAKEEQLNNNNNNKINNNSKTTDACKNIIQENILPIFSYNENIKVNKNKDFLSHNKKDEIDELENKKELIVENIKLKLSQEIAENYKKMMKIHPLPKVMINLNNKVKLKKFTQDNQTNKPNLNPLKTTEIHMKSSLDKPSNKSKIRPISSNSNVDEKNGTFTLKREFLNSFEKHAVDHNNS